MIQVVVMVVVLSSDIESTTDAADVMSSRMISRLPFFNHNAIESSTSSANAEAAAASMVFNNSSAGGAASMTDAFNFDVGWWLSVVSVGGCWGCCGDADACVLFIFDLLIRAADQ